MRLIQITLLSLAFISTTYTEQETKLPKGKKTTTKTPSNKKISGMLAILGVGCVIVGGGGYAFYTKKQKTENTNNLTSDKGIKTTKKTKTTKPGTGTEINIISRIGIDTERYILDANNPECIHCNSSSKDYIYDDNLPDKDDDRRTEALIAIASFSFHTLSDVKNTWEVIKECLESDDKSTYNSMIRKDGVEVALGQIAYHWGSMDKIKQICTVLGYQIGQNEEKICTPIINKINQFMPTFPSIRKTMNENKDPSTFAQQTKPLIKFFNDFIQSISDLYFELGKVKDERLKKEEKEKERSVLKPAFEQAYNKTKSIRDAFTKVEREYATIERNLMLQKVFDDDPMLQYSDGGNITFASFGKNCVEPLKKHYNGFLRHTKIIKEVLKLGDGFSYDTTELDTLRGFIQEVKQKESKVLNLQNSIANDQLILDIFYQNNKDKDEVLNELKRIGDEGKLTYMRKKLEQDYINTIDGTSLSNIEEKGWWNKQHVIDAKQYVQEAKEIENRLFNFYNQYERDSISTAESIHYFNLDEEIKRFDNFLKKAKGLHDNRFS